MRISASIVVLLAIAPFGTALAEEKDPAVEACAGKSEGAPCATQRPIKDEGADLRFRSEPGTCQPEQCCELDYSQGSPPKSVCAACLACKAGGPPAPGTDDGKSEGGPEVEPPQASAGDEPPATSPGKKGCAIGGDPAGLGLVLLVLALRRRLSRSTAPRSS